MRTQIEPFKIKSVEEIPILSFEQREQLIKDACYNTFSIRSEFITIDMLTDSGTTAMSSKQWAALTDADESYAGSRSYYKFESILKEITGFKYILPTHQGRAAERILFSVLGGKGKIIPNNTHFDTTRGNIEFTSAVALDFPTAIGSNPEAIADFKGNMDIEKLEELFIAQKENIPVCMITVTNNSGGGQPVSMQNIRETKALCQKYGIPLFLDCCRFAENAYFIKLREKGYENKTIKEIAREMFSYADGCTMSAKKDGLSNTGGFIGTNDDNLVEHLKVSLIVTEGFLTYGGLARRDLEALAVGFHEVLEENYLAYRVGQIKYFGDKLIENGVPILMPTGGHAVYLDAKRFAPHIPQSQYPGQAIAAEVYKVGGIRSTEIGSVMFGRIDESGNFIPPPMELVRFAVPRRVYTKNHIDYTVEAISEVYNNREKLHGLKITWEPPFLRHFTCKFELV